MKSNFEKLDIDELKKIPSGLNSLKSEVEKLDFDKLKPVSVDLKNEMMW